MTERFPKIDLHMHTTVSDGTDTPEAILARVKAAGIGLFSVTDHDAVEGCRRVLAARTADDPAFITGVEFSCKDEEGQYHVLGYGYAPDAEAINAIVRQGNDFRMQKLMKRLAFLKDRFGFIFSDAETETLMNADNPGKPHIANLMVSKGYAKDRNEAIRTYLNQAHFAEEYVRPEDAIRAISEKILSSIHFTPSLGITVPFLSFRILSDTPHGTDRFAQYSNFWEAVAERAFAVTHEFLRTIPASLGEIPLD